MNLFDQLVDEALRNQQQLSSLRVVVEKELLHHDILREMARLELLSGLTFMGGTCLRACYGSERLSEDLDFTGGRDFNRRMLHKMGARIREALERKYSLKVTVTEPIQEKTNVSTWKMKIITRPQQKNLPAQRVNIDICALPSHQHRPMMLRNIYGVDMGTSGLILQAESREEILADKFIALALRSNRIKYRDLWDIHWLTQQGIELPLDLLPKKIHDHHQKPHEFVKLLQARLKNLSLPETKKEFLGEMRRFLPATTVKTVLEKKDFWNYLTDLLHFNEKKICKKIIVSQKKTSA